VYQILITTLDGKIRSENSPVTDNIDNINYFIEIIRNANSYNLQIIKTIV